MEALHDPKNRAWISDKVDLKHHFDEFAQIVEEKVKAPGLRAAELAALKPKKIMEFMSGADASEGEVFDDEQILEEVQTLCNPDVLTVDNELKPVQMLAESLDFDCNKFSPLPIPDAGAATLRTLNLQKTWLERATKYDKNKRLRNSAYTSNAVFEAAPPKPKRLNDAFLDKEIVAAVRVYRPVKPKPNEPHAITDALRYLQEFHVTGATRLTELRDLIKCVADYTVPGGVADEPAKAADGPPLRARDIYKSGFFFIEGRFYNDHRFDATTAGCHDLSATIREWAASDPKRQIGPFTTAKMEETCVQDLNLRLGYPYVYVHQGEHEHLFSFTDVRLASAADPQRPSDYPFERSIGNKQGKRCLVCSTYTAKWVTLDNERAPENPYFWCDDCYKNFNFDENDQKIGKFVAHQYYDINAL